MNHIDLFSLSPARVQGYAKNTDGKVVPTTEDDRFGLIRGSYVITVLASEQFGIGTTQVQNDTWTRKRLHLPPDAKLRPQDVARIVYKTIFEAERGVSRGKALYDQVEGGELAVAGRAVDGLFYDRFNVNQWDDAQAAEWQAAVTHVAEVIGFGVTDPRKLDAVRALRAASNVRDRTGKPNIERVELIFFMIERLLLGREGDMQIKGWRMGLNQAAIHDVIKTLDATVETVSRVAYQAFASHPLTGNPGNVVRQSNAAVFWRDHARQLRRCQIRPYGGWFHTMSICLDSAANAMEAGDVGTVRKQMILLQGVTAIARTRAALERVLFPVAEMHTVEARLARKQLPDAPPLREFAVAMATSECRLLIDNWMANWRDETQFLSVNDTVVPITNDLTAAMNALERGDITTAYLALKRAARTLERPIVLPTRPITLPNGDQLT